MLSSLSGFVELPELRQLYFAFVQHNVLGAGRKIVLQNFVRRLLDRDLELVEKSKAQDLTRLFV